MSRKVWSGAPRVAWALGLGLTLVALGCSKSKAEPKPEHAEKPHEAPAAEHAEAEPGPAKEEGRKGKRKRQKQEEPPPEPRRYPVPFVWETSPDDPLARARAHAKEILSDNARYAKEHGSRYFDAFAEGQKPRTTLVTCSDSRIQMPAFDATPENDLFVIRNIGNQLETAAGSIEYGVEHLRTAVLLVVGHTGCGAVKAALGKLDALSEPIRRELSPLHLSHQGAEVITDEIWTEAVIENVHNQVKTALERFSSLVQDGKLTVIGGVYDFRNDLKQGSGRLVLVNVNGNVESAAIEAFARAVGSDAKVLVQAKSEAATGSPRGTESGARPAANKEEVAPLAVQHDKEHASEATSEHGSREKTHSNPLREPSLH